MFSFVPKIIDLGSLQDTNFKFDKYIHRELIQVSVTLGTKISDLVSQAYSILEKLENQRSSYYNQPQRRWKVIGLWAINIDSHKMGDRIFMLSHSDGILSDSMFGTTGQNEPRLEQHNDDMTPFYLMPPDIALLISMSMGMSDRVSLCIVSKYMKQLWSSIAFRETISDEVYIELELI